jgi:4-amino-4-deoxy-L-arabinose transferase-like glycosyltransferase
MMTEKLTQSIGERPRIWTDLLTLACVFGVIFFFGLGDVTLVNPDEGRYAEVPREMIAAEDFVTPRLNGVLYLEKPPLVYWAVAGAQRLFGKSEWGMRTVPAMFALAGVLVTYGAARRIGGRTAGIMGAIVLGSSILHFALGRILSLDMAVSMLMSATLFCFILAVREAPGRRRRWLFYGLYVAAALATLAKGLIGFLVPGAVMFLWLLVFNQWHRLRPLYLPSGVALFLAVAAPWHLLAAQRNSQWAHFYFVREHWERFTTTEHGRYEPFWYFIPVIALGFFPWTGALWSALRSRLTGGWAGRRENADTWFFVTWAVFIFLFFSKSQSKLVPYILPVFPPLALIVGAWLAENWVRAEARRIRGLVAGFTVMALAIGAALLVVLFKPGLVADAEKLELLRPAGIAAAGTLLIGGILVPALTWRGRVRGALVAFGITIAAFYLVLGVAQNDVVRPGTKPLAAIVTQRIKSGDRVYHYHDFFHDFTYYAERTVGTIAAPNTELEIWIDPAAQVSGRFIDEAEFRRQWEGPARLWIVARKRAVPTLFADTTFHYHLLGETSGHYLFSNQP